MNMGMIWRGMALGGALGWVAVAGAVGAAVPVAAQSGSEVQADRAQDEPARGDPARAGVEGPAGDVAGAPGDMAASAGDAMTALANGYEDRARSEPERTGLWTACAAAARKRRTAPAAEADAYARGMAAVLTAGPDAATIDAARSPCPDAIPDALWQMAVSEAGIAAPAERPAGPPAASGTDGDVAAVDQPGRDQPGRDLLSGDTREALETASQREQGVDVEATERASLDRLNREAAADSAAATSRIKADLDTDRHRRADYEAAMARYAAEKARNDADTDAARQAQADYDRAMRDYDARYRRR